MFDAMCQINGDFSKSKDFSVIATGLNGLPLVVALEEANGGRIIFDCFRERLFDKQRLLQSARYLKNGAAWLTFSEKVDVKQVVEKKILESKVLEKGGKFMFD